jgi:hypothetical protein
MSSTINTLRELIKTGALGINPETPVTLSYEYSEDVMHYNDDYQDDVFYNSDIYNTMTEFITSGVDKHMLDGIISKAVNESDQIDRDAGYFINDSGDEYSFEEACSNLSLVTDEDADEDENWNQVASKMTFVPEDISEAVRYDYYEFGVDTSLTQYDHKRGLFIISLDLNTTASQLLETTYDFSGFKICLETEVANLELK